MSPVAGDAARGVPGVLVLGLSVNGLGVLQRMAHRGLPVLGMDDRPQQVGFRSRYGRKLVCPSPRSEGRRLVAFMVDTARSTGRRWVIIPTNDEFAEFVSTWREDLSAAFDFALPAHETLLAFSDKWRFHQLAQRHGIAAPVTVCPQSPADLEAWRGHQAFPCLIKPVSTAFWKGSGKGKAFVATSFAELLRGYEELSPGGEVVIQEVIPGGDDHVYFYFAYYDRSGRPHGEFTARKLRQYPPRYGTTCLAESVWMPEMAETSRRFLESQGYRGLVDVEFKRDPRDGTFKIIEINPRLGLQHQLAAGAGADLPWIAYRELAGVAAEPDPVPRDGVKWAILDRDLVSAHHYLVRGELSPSEWWASLRGLTVMATWDWRDPRPFLSLLRLRPLASATYIARRCIVDAIGAAGRPLRAGRGSRPASSSLRSAHRAPERARRGIGG